MALRLAALQLGQQALGVNFQGPSYLKKLNDIESAFAPFDLRDEGLWASELLRQFHLRQTSGTTRIGQQAPEARVLACKRRPGHPGSLLFDFGISQNRLFCWASWPFQSKSPDEGIDGWDASAHFRRELALPWLGYGPQKALLIFRREDVVKALRQSGRIFRNGGESLKT